MASNSRLIELAIKGLEAQRRAIDMEIRELQQQSGGFGPATSVSRVGESKAAAGMKHSPQRQTRPAAATARRSGGLTAEGRRRLSEAAKRRWKENRKSGKSTL
jgi:hypothetical protein